MPKISTCSAKCVGAMRRYMSFNMAVGQCVIERKLLGSLLSYYNSKIGHRLTTESTLYLLSSLCFYSADAIQFCMCRLSPIIPDSIKYNKGNRIGKNTAFKNKYLYSTQHTYYFRNLWSTLCVSYIFGSFINPSFEFNVAWW